MFVVWGLVGRFLVFCFCSGVFSDLEGEVAASTCESLDLGWWWWFGRLQPPILMIAVFFQSRFCWSFAQGLRECRCLCLLIVVFVAKRTKSSSSVIGDILELPFTEVWWEGSSG